MTSPQAPPPPLFISRLSLDDYRSYAHARVEVDRQLVVILGNNGAGKTNLMEALSMLAPGRGLRGAPMADLYREGGSGRWAVAARLHKNDTIDLGTGASLDEGARRQARINGARARVSSLADWLSFLWLTPAMDRIFSDGASARRRFFDRMILALDPEHAVHTARYETAMRARTRILSDPGPQDGAWLSALEAQMAHHGARMAQARDRGLAALSARLTEAPSGAFPRAGVQLDAWDADMAGDTTSAPALEKALMDAFARSRRRDAAAGRALFGPHRTDLVVTHMDKRIPAGQCSTGEQKALLLNLILAHAELTGACRGHMPIMLLDEVAAHLDPGRRAALFARLRTSGAQVWMTGTEKTLFAEIADAARFIYIADGQARVE